MQNGEIGERIATYDIDADGLTIGERRLGSLRTDNDVRFAVLRSIAAATPVQPLAISSLLASSALRRATQ